MAVGFSNTRGRVERSAEQWQSLITKFLRSGMSRAAFCRANNVALSSFGKALRRHDGRVTPTARQLPIAPSPDVAPAFVPVSVPVGDDNGWDVEVQLSASVFVRLRAR
jgi:hypothetical protein